MVLDGADNGVAFAEDALGGRRAGLGVQELRICALKLCHGQLPAADERLLLAGRERLGDVVEDARAGGQLRVCAVFLRELHGCVGYALRVCAALFFMEGEADAAQVFKRQAAVVAAHTVELFPLDLRQHVRVQKPVRDAEEEQPPGLGGGDLQTLVLQDDGTDAEGGLNGLRLLLKGGGKRGIGAHAGHADRRR